MMKREKSIFCLKKNITKIVLGVMAVGMSLLLNGCHGSKGMEAFEVPEQFDESRDYEITFWAKNDTNKAQTKVYENAITEFEKLYPNIKVNIRLYTDYSKIYNDVITNIATNTTPNVCITYPDHIATYLTGVNQVVELEKLFDDPQYGLGGSALKFDSPAKEEMVSEFLEECAFEDHYYAIPYMRSTEVCYINKTYVEKLGYELPNILTWDYIWEVSEAAMEQDSNGNYLVNGQKTLIPFIYKSTDNMMISMLKQLDAGYSTDEGEIEIFNDDTREILKQIASHGQTGAFSTFKISSYPANFLNAGQCIFAIDSTAGSTWMGSKAPLSDISEDSLVDFETVVLPIPQYDENSPKMISQGPSLCVFNKADNQEVMASWLFAQFLLTNDVQVGYAKTEGYVPVTLKAQHSDEYLDYLSRSGEDNNEHYSIKIDATKLLIDNTDNTFVTPVFNGSASLREAAGQMVENSVKTVRRKGTVDDSYIDKLYTDINSLYRLDQIASRRSIKSDEGNDLGPLPSTSVALLISIAVAWILIVGYVIYKKYKISRKIRK